MGLGIFGGGSTSSASSSTTETTTNTSSYVRDIGLTGAQGVELAAVTVAGGVRQSEVGSRNLQIVATELGRGYSQLVSGSSHLIDATVKSQEKQAGILEKATSAASDLSSKALNVARSTIEGAQSGPTATLARNIPAIVGIMGVVLLLPVLLKKKG